MCQDTEISWKQVAHLGWNYYVFVLDTDTSYNVNTSLIIHI